MTNHIFIVLSQFLYDLNYRHGTVAVFLNADLIGVNSAAAVKAPIKSAVDSNWVKDKEHPPR